MLDDKGALAPFDGNAAWSGQVAVISWRLGSAAHAAEKNIPASLR